ncbi:MAG: hypothetical protein KKA07_15100 [Bacteroidetes bacterium]|nr:hypothetical protein [Bacteroidota bacterium]MBU1720388.1 hypothetical protein [Bacteroidota bacterium]
MKKHLIFIAFAVFGWVASYGQQVQLHERPVADTIRPEFGPNLKKYIHAFIECGFFIPVETSEVVDSLPFADFVAGRSNYVLAGGRFKLKLSKWNAIGLETHLAYSSYYLKQEGVKTLPDNFVHNTERLSSFTFGLGSFHRISYGRKGNYIGKFIDLGVEGDVTILSVHYFEDDLVNGSRRKMWYSSKKFHEVLQYDVFARFGFNRYVIFAKYRLSKFFREKHHFNDLPGLSAGFQVGFHQ